MINKFIFADQNISIWYVVQVHCQGGKGRTGTFCSALLLWTGFCTDAEDALDTYARRRTDPRLGRRRRLQGVDSPAQRRYVRYLERAIYSGEHDSVVPAPARRTLLTVVVVEAPPVRRKGGAPARISFIVESLGTVQYDLAKRHGAMALPTASDGAGDQASGAGGGKRDGARLRFELEDGVLVAGDVTVRFFLFEDEAPVPPAGADLGPGARTVRHGGALGRQLCFLSMHTAFHNDGDVMFARAEIDGAYNQPEDVFPADFSVVLTLDSRTEAVASPARSPRARSSRRIPDRPAALKLHSSCNSAGDSFEGSVESSPRSKFGAARAGSSWIPYGLGVGRRRLRLHAAVEAIFAAACPEPRVFRRGERMWCDGGDKQQLCLIIGGAAEFTHGEDGQPPPWINRGDSLARLQVMMTLLLIGQLCLDSCRVTDNTSLFTENLIAYSRH